MSSRDPFALPTDLKIFDSHLHIINPDFPLIPNQGYLPKTFTAEDYLEKTSGIQVFGGAVVSGSFQGFDQSYLIDALNKLGENFVGVTQVPVSISDDALIRLNNAGIKALRFNLFRGGSEAMQHMQEIALRIHEMFGWHIELYINAQTLPDILPILKGLPRVCIDHLGLSEEGLPHLYQFVESGGWVKATGFGRLNFHIPTVLKQITDINPQALIFGSDLPGTRAPRPFEHEDMHIILNALDDTLAREVFWNNAQILYSLV